MHFFCWSWNGRRIRVFRILRYSGKISLCHFSSSLFFLRNPFCFQFLKFNIEHFDDNSTLFSLHFCIHNHSLQNRRIRGASAIHESAREAREFLVLLPSHATRGSRSPRFRLAFASFCLKYKKNYACSAGYQNHNAHKFECKFFFTAVVLFTLN